MQDIAIIAIVLISSSTIIALLLVAYICLCDQEKSDLKEPILDV